MDESQVHFELFMRRTVQSDWRLDCAGEDKAVLIAAGKAALRDSRAIAIKVTRETLDPETRQFSSFTVHQEGDLNPPRRRVAPRDSSGDPPCLTAEDFWKPHARQTIARLLKDFLKRARVTAFELLHRPDLAERLEASGMELQHAMQKVAVAESQASDQSVHTLIRNYQRLCEAALSRVIKAGRADAFPKLGRDGVDAVIARLGDRPDRLFLLGGVVAREIAPMKTWAEKSNRLVELVDMGPEDGPRRAAWLSVIEPILIDIVSEPDSALELMGAQRDLGGVLAAMTQVAAAPEVALLLGLDHRLGRDLAPLTGAPARLAPLVASGEMQGLGPVIARRVIAELRGQRRLRPHDAEGEIQLLRALAMALSATAGRLLSPEEIQEAFIDRSRQLVTSNFVEDLTGGRDDIRAEISALVRLCENVAGSANKRSAARWLVGAVTALRFETEISQMRDTPAGKLAVLAGLQRAIAPVDLSERESADIARVFAALGDQIEAQARVAAQIARARAPLAQRLAALMKMASGEAAPLGPAADRARAEILRLVKAPEHREDLAAAPDMVARVRALLAA